MKHYFEKLYLPSSEKAYYLRPFLLVLFSLVLLILTEYIKSQKEMSLTLPDKINVETNGKSNITFDQEQFTSLLLALENLNTKQPVIIENKLEQPMRKVIRNNKKRHHKRRWHPAGFY